jgi:hypothetical protein
MGIGAGAGVGIYGRCWWVAFAIPVGRSLCVLAVRIFSSFYGPSFDTVYGE